MSLAIVNLDSFFLCGGASFILHLTHGMPEVDVYAVNQEGLPRVSDMRKPFEYWGQIEYIKDSQISILNEYEAVLFAVPRWNCDYEFLKDFHPTGRVGLLFHDNRSILDERLLLSLGKDPICFCLDSPTERLFRDAGLNTIVKLKQPFSRELMPEADMFRTHNKFICTSRFSYSKHVDEVAKILSSVDKEFRLEFWRESWSEVPLCKEMLSDGRIFVNDESFLWEEIGRMYSSSIGLVDGTRFSEKHERTQYTFLEAMHYSCIPICFSDWFCEELVPEETCIELTKENIERILEDRALCSEITFNFRESLNEHDPLKILDTIEYSLLER